MANVFAHQKIFIVFELLMLEVIEGLLRPFRKDSSLVLALLVNANPSTLGGM